MRASLLVVIVAVIALVIGLVLGSIAFPVTETTTQVVITQKTTTVTISGTGTVQSISGTCLQQVPQTAVIKNFQNSTFLGYSVTFSNGTKDFYSLTSCPVPVTPDNYQIDLAIETNPAFIALEDGSIYHTNPFESLAPSMSNSTGEYAVFHFLLYGNQVIYPCGGSAGVYKQLGGIRVTIPINSTGASELSSLEFQAIPLNSLNQYPCMTTT